MGVPEVQAGLRVALMVCEEGRDPLLQRTLDEADESLVYSKKE